MWLSDIKAWLPLFPPVRYVTTCCKIFFGEGLWCIFRVMIAATGYDWSSHFRSSHQSGYVLPNQHIFRKCNIFHYWQNVFCGRVKWLCRSGLARDPRPAGRGLENPYIDYEEEWWQRTPLSETNAERPATGTRQHGTPATYPKAKVTRFVLWKYRPLFQQWQIQAVS